MTLIAKPYTFTASTVAESAEVNADFDAIYNDYNGNITDANIKANAGIALSKLAFTSQLGPILRSTSQICISVGITGDSSYRFAVLSDGFISFGNGTSQSAGLWCGQTNYANTVFATNGSGAALGNLGGGEVMAMQTFGDDYPCIHMIAANTTIDFGSGGAAVPDLSLKRESSTTLALKNGHNADNAYRNFRCANISAAVLTLSTPLTKSNANSGIVRKVMNIPVVNGTIADGATYTVTVPVHRAGTVTSIKVSIGTAIVGGTNTLAITKNGTTTLISAATIDPTTFAANTATTLTLTAIPASLVFAAGDIIKIVHVAGTQSTDGVGETVSIEYETDDF